MTERDFLTSFSGIFERRGVWKDAYSQYHSIDEMSEEFKRRVVRHLLKGLVFLDKIESTKKGTVEFSGEYAKEMSTKLMELGLPVKEIDGKFCIAIGDYQRFRSFAPLDSF